MFVKAVARVKQSAAAKVRAHAAAVSAAKKSAAALAGGGDASADEGDASADENDAPAAGDERRRRILQLDTDMSAFAAEEAAKRAAMHETDLDEVEDTAGDTRTPATDPRACRRSRRATTFAPRPRG